MLFVFSIGPSHKAACKKMAGGSGGSPSSPPAFPIPQSASEAFNNLRMLKEKQQKAMSSGNLKMAVMIGKQVLGLISFSLFTFHLSPFTYC